ncbi:hypothetical protein BX600DRAFT_539067, partial [Xylariales sp. PMI_506]
GANTLPNWPDFLNDLREQLADPVVNVNHIELLVHFVLFPVIPKIDASIMPDMMEIILQSTLGAPYLLHEVLALSSQHLACLNPTKSEFYLHQAVQLQTRSLSIFKTSQLLIDSSQWIPMLLYSSFLGTHLLADTLAYPTIPFMPFHDKLMQTVTILRGVRAVVRSVSWETVSTSELSPMIKWGSPPDGRIGQGKECDKLKQLLVKQTRQNESLLAANQEVVDYLQAGFDEIDNPTPGHNPWLQPLCVHVDLATVYERPISTTATTR